MEIPGQPFFFDEEGTKAASWQEFSLLEKLHILEVWTGKKK